MEGAFPDQAPGPWPGHGQIALHVLWTRLGGFLPETVTGWRDQALVGIEAVLPPGQQPVTSRARARAGGRATSRPDRIPLGGAGLGGEGHRGVEAPEPPFSARSVATMSLETEAGMATVTQACKVMDLSRAAYYAAPGGKRPALRLVQGGGKPPTEDPPGDVPPDPHARPGRRCDRERRYGLRASRTPGCRAGPFRGERTRAVSVACCRGRSCGSVASRPKSRCVATRRLHSGASRGDDDSRRALPCLGRAEGLGDHATPSAQHPRRRQAHLGESEGHGPDAAPRPPTRTGDGRPHIHGGAQPPLDDRLDHRLDRARRHHCHHPGHRPPLPHRPGHRRHQAPGLGGRPRPLRQALEERFGSSSGVPDGLEPPPTPDRSAQVTTATPCAQSGTSTTRSLLSAGRPGAPAPSASSGPSRRSASG